MSLSFCKIKFSILQTLFEIGPFIFFVVPLFSIILFQLFTRFSFSFLFLFSIPVVFPIFFLFRFSIIAFLQSYLFFSLEFIFLLQFVRNFEEWVKFILLNVLYFQYISCFLIIYRIFQSVSYHKTIFLSSNFIQ